MLETLDAMLDPAFNSLDTLALIILPFALWHLLRPGRRRG